MGYYPDAEIVGMFRNSLDPESQIDILSQLNCCTKDEIKSILIRYGVDINKSASSMAPKTGHYRRARSKEQLDAVIRPCYVEGMSDAKIAKICNTTSKTVQRWRERNNLPPN